MKKILLTVILASTLTACTNENSNKEVERPDISLNAGVGVVVGSGEFGQLGPKDSKILSFKITNSGDAPLQGPPQLDNNNFSIVYQSGCASILPKKSCTIKVNFSAVGKLYQSYSANLALDSVLVALSAEVVDPNPSQGISVSFSASPLDFGTISDKQSVVKNISITNTGSTTLNLPVSAPPVSSGFSIIYDSCSNKNIAPNKSCSLKIAMSGAVSIGGLEADIIYGDVLTLTGQVVSSSGSSSLGSPNVQLLINNQVSSSYDFGSLSGSEAKQVIIVAKNNGTKASNLSTTQLSSLGYTIAFDQCNNKSLAPGASCQIRVLFSASGKAPNTYAASLSFAGQSVSLSSIVVSSSTNIITYQLEYSEYSLCSSSLPCQGQGIQSRNATCRQYINSVLGNLVDISNCPPPTLLTLNCSSPEGTKDISITGGFQTYLCLEGSTNEIFQSVTCEPGYLISGQNCILDNSFQISSFLSVPEASSILAPGIFQAQSFILPIKMQLDYIELKFRNNNTTTTIPPSGTLFLNIGIVSSSLVGTATVSGAFPGTVFGNSDNPSLSTILGPAPVLIRFYFSNPVILDPDIEYFFALNSSVPSGTIQYYKNNTITDVFPNSSHLSKAGSLWYRLNSFTGAFNQSDLKFTLKGTVIP